MLSKFRTNLGQSFMVGIAVSFVSLLRVSIGNRSAIGTILWAEDGLFPLCVRNHGLSTCLLDPYGGSMHFLPKVLAALIAPMPFSIWPIFANVVAALVVGVVGGIVFLLFRKTRHSLVLAIALGVLPALHTSLGVESVNVYTASYIPVAYLFVVMFLVPPIFQILNKTILWIFTFVSVLTLPSLIAVVIVALVVNRAKDFDGQKWIRIIVASAVGAITQLSIMSQVSNDRTARFSQESLGNWALQIPARIAESIVGPSDFSRAVLRISVQHTWVFAGASLALLIGLCIAGLYSTESRRSASAFLLSGLVLSAIPSIFFFPVNRYFVWLQLNVAAAAVYLILRSSSIRKIRLLVLCALLVPMLLNLPAKSFRVSEEYQWERSVSLAVRNCQDFGVSTSEIFFAPGWPVGSVRSFLTVYTDNRI